MSVNALTIITAALRELGVEAQGETPSTDNTAFMFGKLNQMVDGWCAQNRLLYARGFAVYTIIPNHQPHTIGIAANAPDFTVTVGRPVEIISARLVLTSSTPNMDVPLELIDDDGWSQIGIKGMTSTLPAKLYYSPDFPNGSIYLWPIPTTVNNLRLETRNLVSSFVDLVTLYNLPYGYEDALIMSLAEKCLSAYPRPEMAAQITKQAREARAVIGSVNSRSPDISTDIGRSSRKAAWNWSIFTGGYRP